MSGPPSSLSARLAGLLRGPVTPAVRLATVAGAGVLLYGLYGTVGVLTAQSDAPLHTLPVFVDRWVPRAPVWVVFYLALFPQVLVPAVLVEDRRVLFRGSLAYGLLVLLGLPFWMFWPVTVPRPDLPVTDLYTWGVALTRWLDPPTNCFPSMHVAESYLAALVVSRCNRRLGGLLLGMATLIWYSTLAIGQHWFVDGLAGAGLALVVDAVVFRLRPLPAEAFASGPAARMGWIVLLYAVLFGAAALPWWTGVGVEAVVGSQAW